MLNKKKALKQFNSMKPVLKSKDIPNFEGKNIDFYSETQIEILINLIYKVENEN